MANDKADTFPVNHALRDADPARYDGLVLPGQRGLPAVETRSRAESLVDAFVRTWRDQTNRG